MSHERGCEVAWWGGALVVSGEIDHATSSTLTRAIDAHLAGGNRRVVIDLAGCTFCDSSCVHALVAPARAGVHVVVRRPSEAVRKVLAVAGVDQLLDIED